MAETGGGNAHGRQHHQPAPQPQQQNPSSLPPPLQSSKEGGEQTPEVQRRKPGPPKRKAANSSTPNSSNKRMARERDRDRDRVSAVMPAFLQQHSGPITRAARQSPNKFPSNAAAGGSAAGLHSSSSSLGKDEVVMSTSSSEQIMEVVAKAAVVDDDLRKQELEVLYPFVDAELEAVRCRAANAHVVPVHAGWFSWEKVHLIEERALPSFFGEKLGNRDPQAYLEIRNQILKKYHCNPQEHVSMKDLSEINGDDKTKKEILDFLSHWGLINFHPFPPETANGAKDSSKSTSIVDKLYQFHNVHPVSKLRARTDASVPSLLPLPETALPDVVVPSDGPAVDYHCNSCSADCSRKRFHCQKQADFDLCPECYNEGKFGLGMTSADFILMEPATEKPGVSGGSWTDQEALLLLEALELYGENWTEIAEHVATKTKAQCFLHFMTMPIEDPFLDGKESTDVSIPEDNDRYQSKEPADIKTGSGSAQGEEGTGPSDKLSSFPSNKVGKDQDSSREDAQESVDDIAVSALKAAFQAVGAPPGAGGSPTFVEVGNPVMALAAYFVAMIDQEVSDNSVKSSLRSSSEVSPNIQLASRHCFFLEDSPNASKDASEPKSTHVEEVEESLTKETKMVANEENKPKAFPECSSTKVEDVAAASTEQQVEKTLESELPSSLPLPTEASLSLRTEQPTKTVSSTPFDKEQEEQENRPSSTDAEAAHDKGHCDTTDEKGQEEKQNDPSRATLQTTTAAAGGGGCKEQETRENELLTAVAKTAGDKELEGKENQTPDVVDNAAGDVSVNRPNLEKEKSLTEQKDDKPAVRIQRAAQAAVSAAAVKAKLLASHEEEQICQLMAFIVEKQIHKLETKMALAADIERVFLRVRDQIERRKQKLMLERNQLLQAKLSHFSPGYRAGAPARPTVQPLTTSTENSGSNITKS